MSVSSSLERLLEGMVSYPNLRHLVLEDCFLNRASSQRFAQAVSHSNINTVAVYIDVYEEPTYVEMITSALRQYNHCKIQHLYITTMGDFYDFKDEFIAFFEVIGPSNLTSLDLGWVPNRITIKYLIDYIPQFTQLRSFSFDYHDDDDEERYHEYDIYTLTDKLLRAIEQNTSLTELDVVFAWRDPAKYKTQIQNYCMRNKHIPSIILNPETISWKLYPFLYQTIVLQWKTQCHHHARNTIYQLLLSLEK
jgi:hypothetical protein